MQRLFKHITLAVYGGIIYYIIELIFKHYVSGGKTHWSMAIIGGIMFSLIGGLNNYLPWNMSLVLQSLIGAVVITATELVAGLILNVWLGLGVWDYSNLPFNFLGQISLPFTIVWIGLSFVAIILDDYLRYWLWGEKKPYYYLVSRKNKSLG